MPRYVNVGLIGYGLAGEVFHAPLVNSVPGLKLTKVVERHRQASRARYPWVEVVNDAGALFNDDSLELIVVATPNDSHLDFAQRALLAGKHVVVDKPFTITSQDARQLIDLARERGKVLSVFQNRRWDSDFQTVQKIVADGHLGRLVEYEAHFNRFRNEIKPDAWRESGEPGSGLLYDLGSHLIDQAQVLFGLPQAVTADVRVQRDGGRADDRFEVNLHYDQLKVTLTAGVLMREVGPHFVLHGTAGSFVKYGLDPQEDALKLGGLPHDPNWGQEPPELWGRLNTQLDGLHFEGRVETLPGRYQAYYENIYAAITQPAELLVKPETAFNTIRLIETASQSHAEKRTITFSA